MAGSNDFNSEENYGKLFNTLNAKYFKNCNIFMCILPKRHDLPLNHNINQKVSLINHYLSASTLKMKNVTLIDVSLLDRKYYTLHGMHLNYKGKLLISNILLRQMQDYTPHEHILCTPTLPNTSVNKEDICSAQLHSYSKAVQLTKEDIGKRRNLDVLDTSKDIQNLQYQQKTFVSHW